MCCLLRSLLLFFFLLKTCIQGGGIIVFFPRSPLLERKLREGRDVVWFAHLYIYLQSLQHCLTPSLRGTMTKVQSIHLAVLCSSTQFFLGGGVAILPPFKHVLLFL